MTEQPLRPAGLQVGSAPPNSRLMTALTVLLGLAIAPQVVAFFIQASTYTAFPYQLDYAEGPILQLAVRITRGQDIYPPISGYPYVIASYMPLYYLISALGISITGPSFFLGRLLSVVATLVVALCVGLIVWHQTRHRSASALAAALVLVIPPFRNWGSYMRVDMTALALSVAGFYAFQRGRTAGGISLFALSPLARRSTVAGMVAAFIALGSKRGWRATARIAVVQVVVIAVLVGAALLWTRGGLYRQLAWHTASSRDTWTWHQMGLMISVFYRWWPGYVAAIAFAAVWTFACGRHRVFLVYFLLASAVAMTGGRVGSNLNYLLEPLAVGAMLIGLLWSEMSRREGPESPGGYQYLKRLLFLGVALALVLQLAWSDLQLPALMREIRARTPRESGRYVVERIASAPGPVLCEHVGLIELAGRETLLEPFEFTQMAHAGVLDPSPLLEDVRRGRFPLIVLTFNPRTAPHKPGGDWRIGRWSDSMIQLLMQRYELEAELPPFCLYVPREQPAPPAPGATPEEAAGTGERAP
jgi:hypothetical protein